MEGIIFDVLKGDNFKIKTNTQNHFPLCKPSGRLRLHKINLTIGDKVKIKLSPYDLNKGFITYRL